MWRNLGIAALAAGTAAGWGLVLTGASAFPSTEAPTAAATSAVSASATASPSATRTPSPTPSKRPATLAAFKTALNAPDGATALVLGDASSNDRDEWVTVWGRHLGLSAAAEVRRLEPGTLTYRPPFVFTGGTRPVRVFNASRPEQADWPVRDLAALAPEKPGVVILNMGRNDTATTIAPRLTTLRAAVTKAFPDAELAVVLQAPTADDGQAATRTATAAWARKAGVPVIDVYAATKDKTDLVSETDPLSLSPAGSDAWAQAVDAALRS